MAGTDEMLAYLETCEKHHGHVHGAPTARNQAPGNSTCWTAEDVLKAPGFFEFALATAPTVQGYLGTDALLYSFNAFTTYPVSGPKNPDIQEWHRDRDDVAFLALFVYLTDVESPADGPHLYRRGTHLYPEGTGIEEVYGPRGTAFLADGRGLHLGGRPEARPRTIAWARWGVSDPPHAYGWNKTQPVSRQALGARFPQDARTQRMLKLVVA